MTISSTNRKAGPFIGNGSASVFSFNFRVFSASDLKVVRLNVATGTETILALNSAYTVILNANQNSNPGGSITLTGGALAAGFNLTINSGVENLQPTDLTNQGGFYPEVITDSFDRATIQIQQLEEELNRALKYPVSDPALGTELPAVAQRAGKALSFDSLGNPIAVNLNIPSTVTLDGAIEFETFAAMKADVSLSYSNVIAGRTIHVRGGDFTYIVLASSASSYHVITNGGLKLNAVVGANGVSIKAFGAVGDGSTNDTAAIQLAFNSGVGSIYVPPGTYSYSSALTISSTLRLHGEGTFNETTLLESGIIVTANNVVIENVSFSGPEVYAAWSGGTSVYRQAFKQFVYFNGCSRGVFRNVRTSGKRAAVTVNNCYDMLLEGNRHESFFPAIDTVVTDSNYNTCYRVIGGARNQLLNNSGSYCGSVVLIGSESSNNTITNTMGRQCHDNGIYNSSGNYSSFVGGTFEDVDGSGVKVRGSGHSISGFTIVRCGPLGAAAITLTGNGNTLDAFGANGCGTICYGNTIVQCAGQAILVGAQDGPTEGVSTYLARDFVISNNTIENHTGTAGNCAISVSGQRGMKVSDNIVRGSTADYAIGVFGPVGGRSFDFDVSGNTASNCVVGIYAQRVDKSLFANNTVSGNSSYVFEFRVCDQNFLVNNTSGSSQAILLSASSGRECYNNVATNNNVYAVSGNSTNNIAPLFKYSTGTWAPSYGTTGTDFSSVTYTGDTQGFFIRFGRFVFVSGVIGTNAITAGAASGDAIIKGLPFGSSDGGAGAQAAVSISKMSGFGTNHPSSGVILRNKSSIALRYRASANGADTALSYSDLDPGSSKNLMVFSATYVTDD